MRSAQRPQFLTAVSTAVLPALLVGAALVLPGQARAALGATVASIESDRAALGATRELTPMVNYDVHELTTAAGTYQRSQPAFASR